jgi:hypothetical protein
MLSPQQQAIDRIWTEGWNSALVIVKDHVRSMGGTISLDDMDYIINEESIPEAK